MNISKCRGRDKLPPVLKDLRRKRALSQEELSKLIEVPLKRYQSWEEGRAVPDIYSVYLISKVGKTSMDDIVRSAYKIAKPKNETEDATGF